MRRALKVLLWVGGIVVVLLVALVVGLKVYLTKERILAWTVPPLEEKLHRRVTVADAGAGLTGIHLDGLDVRKEGAAHSLVSAEELRVRWNLWALLSRRVEVEEVRLVKPRIYLVRLPDGSLSIDDLLTPAAPATPAPTPPPESKESGGGAPVAVAVALISLEDGRVSFEDQTQKPPQTYVLDAIDSRVSDLSLDHPFRYELSAKLPLATAGRFSAEGTVDPKSNRVAARLAVKDFDLPSLDPLLQGGTRFTAGTAGLELRVDLAGGSSVDADGSLEVKGLELASGERRGQVADVKVVLAGGADLQGGKAELRKLDITAAQQVVHVEATVARLKARPQVQFQLTSPELRVDALTALLPPGEGKETSSAPSAPAASGPAAPASVPLDAAGDVRVDRLLAGGVTVESVKAHIALERGVLEVKPAGAGLYGGTLTLGARAELEKAGPPFDASAELSGTSVADLLAALSPKLADTMTGTLGLTAEARGLGGDLAALNSQVRAEAKDGKIVDQPLVREFANLFQVKELETLNFYSLRTDLQTAGGIGTVKSLILSGPNLQATGRGTVGLVDHALDLQLAVAVPKRIAGKLVKDSNILGAVTDKEGWSRLPLHLGGSLEEPSYGLDAQGLADAAAKALGGKAGQQLEEKVLKKLPLGEGEKGLLEGGVKKLFGQ